MARQALTFVILLLSAGRCLALPSLPLVPEVKRLIGVEQEQIRMLSADADQTPGIKRLALSGAITRMTWMLDFHRAVYSLENGDASEFQTRLESIEERYDPVNGGLEANKALLDLYTVMVEVGYGRSVNVDLFGQLLRSHKGQVDPATLYAYSYLAEATSRLQSLLGSEQPRKALDLAYGELLLARATGSKRFARIAADLLKREVDIKSTKLKTFEGKPTALMSANLSFKQGRVALMLIQALLLEKSGARLTGDTSFELETLAWIARGSISPIDAPVYCGLAYRLTANILTAIYGAELDDPDGRFRDIAIERQRALQIAGEY